MHAPLSCAELLFALAAAKEAALLYVDPPVELLDELTPFLHMQSKNNVEFFSYFLLGHSSCRNEALF